MVIEPGLQAQRIYRNLRVFSAPPFPTLGGRIGARLALPTGCLLSHQVPLPPLHPQTRSTHLCSSVPPGWAGLWSSDVVIAWPREGPGGLGSSARIPHGCLQAGDTASGCPSPEQPPTCSRAPEWQPAGGPPTSTMPRWEPEVRRVSCFDGSDEEESHLPPCPPWLRPERAAGLRLGRQGTASGGGTKECVRPSSSAPQHLVKQ